MLFPSSGVLLCSRVIADDDYTLYFKKLDRGYNDDSEVKSAHCSCRRQELSSQLPRGLMSTCNSSICLRPLRVPASPDTPQLIIKNKNKSKRKKLKRKISNVFTIKMRTIWGGRFIYPDLNSVQCIYIYISKQHPLSMYDFSIFILSVKKHPKFVRSL